jgi:glutathione synthase
MLEHFLGSESAIWGCRRNRSHCVRKRHPLYLDGDVGALDSEDVDIVAVVDCLQSDSPTSGREGEPPGTRLTRIKAQQLVLKPQRMGGGNDAYREASLRFWTVYMQKNVRHGLQ